MFAEANPTRAANDEREEIAGVFYNRVEHVFMLCNGSKCWDLTDKQREAQCRRDKRDFGETIEEAVRGGSVAFGNSRWNLVMNGTAMKPVVDLCRLPHSEIKALEAAISAASIIMVAGANDDAVAFNRNGPPSNRMIEMSTIGRHHFHHFVTGRECG